MIRTLTWQELQGGEGGYTRWGHCTFQEYDFNKIIGLPLQGSQSLPMFRWV